MSAYDVVLKKVSDAHCRVVRGVIAAPSEQKPLWDELVCDLESKGSSPEHVLRCIIPKNLQWDIEVAGR